MPHLDRPTRLQRSRKKGWRKPENAIIVDRTSKWGNPFRIGESLSTVPAGVVAHARLTEEERNLPINHSMAKKLHRAYLLHTPEGQKLVEKAKTELRGHDLICFCPLDGPCHADNYLELANE